MRHISPQSLEVAPQIVLPTRAIGRTVAALATIVICAGVFREWYVNATGAHGRLGDLRHLALFDSQFSIGAWFESSLLLAAGVMFSIVFLRAKSQADPDTTRWAVLASLFVMLSMDKIANAHQVLLTLIYAEGATPTTAIWLPVLPAVALSSYLFPMLRRMPREYAIRFFVCAVCFVGGATVMDAVSATLMMNFGTHSVAYVSTSLIEESLEVVGAAALCLTLGRFISARHASLSIRFA